jgi:hypothetical protein
MKSSLECIVPDVKVVIGCIGLIVLVSLIACGCASAPVAKKRAPAPARMSIGVLANTNAPSPAKQALLDERTALLAEYKAAMDAMHANEIAARKDMDDTLKAYKAKAVAMRKASDDSRKDMAILRDKIIKNQDKLAKVK